MEGIKLIWLIFSMDSHLYSYKIAMWLTGSWSSSRVSGLSL